MSVTRSGDHEYEEINIESVQALDSNTYVNIKKNQITQDVVPTGNTHKENKLEKCLVILVVTLSLIVAASIALVAAAYTEFIQMKIRLNSLEEEMITGHNNSIKITDELRKHLTVVSLDSNNINSSLLSLDSNLVAHTNETKTRFDLFEKRINFTYDTIDGQHVNYYRSLEEQVLDLNHQISSGINKLNSSISTYLDELLINIMSQVTHLKNEVYLNTSNISNTIEQSVDNLITQLVSDIKYLHVFESCTAQ